jgi:hypothetical protein
VESFQSVKFEKKNIDAAIQNECDVGGTLERIELKETVLMVNVTFDVD